MMWASFPFHPDCMRLLCSGSPLILIQLLRCPLHSASYPGPLRSWWLEHELMDIVGTSFVSWCQLYANNGHPMVTVPHGVRRLSQVQAGVKALTTPPPLRGAQPFVTTSQAHLLWPRPLSRPPKLECLQAGLMLCSLSSLQLAQFSCWFCFLFCKAYPEAVVWFSSPDWIRMVPHKVETIENNHKKSTIEGTE